MSFYDDEDYGDEEGGPCSFCGDWECDGSGYNCNEEDYNLRDDSMVPPVSAADAPDDDRWQEFKDGVAMGYINPDGSQRDPDPPEDYGDGERMSWVPRTEDGGPDDPWALPEGETYETETPF